MRRINRYTALMAILISLQGAFWWSTHRIRPATDIVPAPPGKSTLHALSFGDDEFYFRVQTMLLQNFGDQFGRTVPLRYYDYARLFEWLTLLDTLDSRSDMLPSMAAYYFSQSQDKIDNRYMVNYLYAHAIRDVPHKWWWLLQASYLAMHNVHDMDLALKAARPMINDGVPVWAQQMVAVVYEKRGEMEDALNIMETIQQNVKELSDKDLRYMRYFVDERLKKLEKQQGSTGGAHDAP